VYDPLGLAAPFILPAKILLQSLCQKNLGWDQEIEGPDLQRWQTWLRDLPELQKYVVPRCVKPKDFGAVRSSQVHHFADASEVGYGTASYLRLENFESQTHCILLIGKARVAPLKTTTIPRLELTAATTAVKMNYLIVKELDYPVDDTYFWTDSTAVLRYIRNETSRYKTFVANRVASILDGSTTEQWNHVPTKENPADDASRGLPVDQFLKNQRWTDGPQFLHKPKDQWPKDVTLDLISDDDPELKRTSGATLVSTNVVGKMVTHFSDWTKLKRAVAWLLVLKRCLKLKAARRRVPVVGNPPSTLPSALRIEDLKSAEEVIFRHAQAQHFQEEIIALQEGRVPKGRHNLSRLDPYLQDQLLHVGGRLGRARLPAEMKYPIILPKESRVSSLILEHVHRTLGHMGRNAMLAKVRERFWILQANTAIRRIVSKCVICRLYQAKAGIQKMANLPIDRLVPDEAPFSRTGVDYFGPFEIHRGRSVLKRYGVVFTCMASRAIHLEVAHSMDTDSCLNAFRRFIARRGQVKLIRSDNGSNFVGAVKIMQDEIKKWNQAQIRKFLMKREIVWEFNPPAGSHFGGIWERQIRTIRKTLYALLKGQNIRLDDENLHTLFCEVESIVNSRPITAVPEDATDMLALSPNHLLLLQPSQQLAPGVFTKEDNYARRRWRQVQHLANVFWRRWVNEYLPLLQQRQKWLKKQRNVREGDIVLMVDQTAPRVKVKTKSGEFVRPIHKLCLILESDEEIKGVDKDKEGSGVD
jgi:transposase InsO family protein